MLGSTLNKQITTFWSRIQTLLIYTGPIWSCWIATGLFAQTLTGTFQSKTIVIGSATGPAGLSVAFTTPGITSSLNPQLPLNGEFQPSDTASIQYRSYWVMSRLGTFIDLGLVGFGSTAVKTDSDGDGIPDFAELFSAANVSATILAISDLTGSLSGGTINLNRNAGQESGIAVTRFDSGNVFTGIWRLPIYQVSGTYDASQKSVKLRATSSLIKPGNFSASYNRISDNEIYLSNNIFRLDDGSVLSVSPITFLRFGKTYRALGEFVDGNLATSFPDFQRWTLQLDDNSDSDGDGVPNLSDASPFGSPPAITLSPRSIARQVGQSVQFSVVASGSGLLRYQWRFNGSVIPGATAATFSIGSLRLVDAGDYSVTVGNDAGEVLSEVAKLTLTSPVMAPAITQQPIGMSVQEDETVSLSVTATGTPPLNYQWKRNGQNIQAAVESTYTLGNLQLTDSGAYAVVVSNSAGSVSSQPAVLTVTPAVVAPVITMQPQDAVAVEGGSVSFTVTATGTGPLSYQWRKNGEAMPGATKSNLNLSGVQPLDSGGYSVTIFNSAGQVTTASASLLVQTISTLPVILTQPLDLTVEAPNAATFSVVASGAVPMSYEWRKAGVAIPGNQEPTLVIPFTRFEDAGNYSVIVSNGAGTVMSRTANLLVTQPKTGLRITKLNLLSDGAVSLVIAASTGQGIVVQRSGELKSWADVDNFTATSGNTERKLAKSVDAGAFFRLKLASVAGALPTIVRPPSSVTVVKGNRVTLRVQAEGPEPITYQWQKDGVSLIGANGANYAIVSAQVSDSGTYTVLVSNPAGTVTSEAAELVVRGTN